VLAQADRPIDQSAGPDRPVVDSSVLRGAQTYTFTTAGGSGLTKSERFCLPSDQKLIRVTDVATSESNDKSTINVRPDTEKNCVDLDVLLPPAKAVCIRVPTIHGFNVKFDDRCTYIPTTIRFSVNYEAGRVPEVANNPTVPVPPPPRQ
jgi:hypothetical protein